MGFIFWFGFKSLNELFLVKSYNLDILNYKDKINIFGILVFQEIIFLMKFFIVYFNGVFIFLFLLLLNLENC